MALSDYLTSDEWDGCFYYYAGLGELDFGASIKELIPKLIAKGYRFTGFDKDGNKFAKIHNTGNAEKLVTAMFDNGKADLRKALISGREFIKKHAPELLTETDAEWNTMLENIK